MAVPPVPRAVVMEAVHPEGNIPPHTTSYGLDHDIWLGGPLLSSIILNNFSFTKYSITGDDIKSIVLGVES